MIFAFAKSVFDSAVIDLQLTATTVLLRGYLHAKCQICATTSATEPRRGIFAATKVTPVFAATNICI